MKEAKQKILTKEGVIDEGVDELTAIIIEYVGKKRRYRDT